MFTLSTNLSLNDVKWKEYVTICKESKIQLEKIKVLKGYCFCISLVSFFLEINQMDFTSKCLLLWYSKRKRAIILLKKRASLKWKRAHFLWKGQFLPFSTPTNTPFLSVLGKTRVLTKFSFFNVSRQRPIVGRTFLLE